MTVTYRSFDPALAGSCGDWTFPSYRHLLELAPAPRNPAHGDRRQVRPLALMGAEGGEAVALALGCVPTEDDAARRPAELLSIFVRPDRRRRGIAGEILGRLEEEVRRAGAGHIETVYMAGGTSGELVERLLAARGWTPPQPRMTVARFTVAQAERTPWFGRYRWRSRTDYGPWTEVGDDEIERLRASHRATGWIAEDLVPWQFDRRGVEPHSSLAIRREGELVGWVINHRLPSGTLRFTCSFVHPELKQRGRILPAYCESIRRGREAGYERCTFTVPAYHPAMVGFVQRWCAPWASFVGETRESAKPLAAA